MASNVKITPVNIEERKNLNLRSGDNIRVWQKIKEGDKTRLQAFEGMILSRKHGNEAGATFTVRKIIDGVGVERTFPLYSPVIDEIEIISKSKIRRAKLYFVRRKAAKELRKRMKAERVMKPEAPKDEEAPKEEAKA